jgi:hypothetical protein
MPLRLRSWLYQRYWEALREARGRIEPLIPLPWPRHATRATSNRWKVRLLETVFGSIWWRLGPFWISGRLGFGRFSGRIIAWLERYKPWGTSENPTDAEKKLEEDAATAVQE